MDPESRILLKSINKGTIFSDSSVDAIASTTILPPPPISGAFSVNGMHGIIGDFSSEEISFLATHNAVKVIEEDNIAEVAIGDGYHHQQLNSKTFLNSRNILMEENDQNFDSPVR